MSRLRSRIDERKRYKPSIGEEQVQEEEEGGNEINNN